ncbi:MAG: outer membrane beta-barrel protein [Bacteroidales bacterium]|nr:outer membrane beta-barrel protein [Bacteroidales bacterium]
MNDTEYRSYFQQRLSNYQSDKVPEFDQLFSKAELAAVSAKTSGFRLWPVVLSITSAAAVVALLLILWPAAKDSDYYSYNKFRETFVLPEASSIEINKRIQVYDEPVLLSTAALPDNSHRQVLRRFETIDVQIPVSPVNTASESVLSENTDDGGQETGNSNILQEQVPAGRYQVSELISQNTYERSIQEAHRLATENARQKRSIFRPRLGFSVNQNNGLLASVSPSSYQSMVASVANDYQNAYSVLNAGNLMRSGEVDPNAWEQPGNLVLPVVEKPNYHFPLNLSLSVSLPLSSRLELQTGLSYSYLTATTRGETELYSFTLFQELHYLGIPLRIAYRMIDSDRFGMYTSLGGSIEKGLTGRQKNTVVKVDNRRDVWTGQQSVHGIQPIASAQLGFDYALNSKLQLYLEPGVVYYFDTNQPLSIRTKSPLFFNLGLGLRYRI